MSQKERNVFQFSDAEEAGGEEEEPIEVSWQIWFSTRGVIVSPLVNLFNNLVCFFLPPWLEKKLSI